MTPKPMKSARRAGPLAALLIAAIAMLALAGPASSHDESDDHPGFDHGGVAGQIASFDPESGVLVIDLAEGGSISGLVTKWTWIESDDHGWRHGWWRHSGGSTDDLVPGATVEDALLALKDGRAFFWRIELDD